jgi:hypothetical protein
MIAISALSAAFAALLVPGAGAASAAPARALEPVQWDETPVRPGWSSPMAIEARPQPRGVYASTAFYYGDYRGRKLELKEVLVGGAITPNVSAWYSRQDVLLKGRSRSSRFDLNADTYGVRWIVRPPREEDDRSLAVEFEAVRPDTATARTSNARATYIATKNNTFAVTGHLGRALQAQLAYTKVEGVDGEEANVFALVGAKDFALSDRFNVRVQGHLIGQGIRGSIDDVDFEVKPMGYVALGYRIADGVQLETDLTYMPSGTPLAAGRLSSLTSFQIYRPGGPAAGLRRDAFGVGAIRLVVRKSF